MRHGTGTYSWVHGDQYVGEWKFDRMNGRGRFRGKDGSEYVGEFVNDNKVSV
jgi:hypothetical protein